jgi:hypothetical protein
VYYKIGLKLFACIFLFNFSLNKKFENSLANNKLPFYSYYNKYLYSRGPDSIYIKKFQGLGIFYYPYVLLILLNRLMKLVFTD